MSKKIIAVSLALFLIVTCFVGCEKKEKPEDVTLINGEKVAFVKDANGNIKEDKNGNPMVYVLDEKGYFKKNDDGSYREAPLNLPDYIVNGGKLETKDYVLTMSDEWEAAEDGRIVLKANKNTYVTVLNLGKGIAFNDYIAKSENQIKDIVKGVKEKNMDATYKKYEGTMSSISCVLFDFNCIADGKQVFASYVGYFERNGYLFKFEYVCQDGNELKDAETVKSEINNGLKFK